MGDKSTESEYQGFCTILNIKCTYSPASYKISLCYVLYCCLF